MAAIVIALALAAAPLGWIARRFVYRDLGETTPSRLRRALAAAWTFVIFAVLPLAGLGVLAGALDSFDLSDPSMQGVIDAAFEAARVLIAVNALGRGMLAPGRPAWRLVPISDRSAGILYRLAMTFAAIWAVERLVEPAADAAASLNIAVATRGVGAIIAAIAIAYAMRQLGAQPTGAQGSPQSEAWAPLRTLGWAAALIIFLAAVTGYVAFATFLVNQAIYLSIVGAPSTSPISSPRTEPKPSSSRMGRLARVCWRWRDCAAMRSRRSPSSCKASPAWWCWWLRSRRC